MASKSEREKLQALVKKCHNLRRDISKYSAELKQKDDDSLFSKFEERTEVADDEIEEVVELVGGQICLITLYFRHTEQCIPNNILRIFIYCSITTNGVKYFRTKG